MAVLNNLLGFCFLYLVFLGPIKCSDEICVQQGPCKCVYPNGTGVDLSPSVLPKGFYSVPYYKPVFNGTDITKYDLHTYYFHPCTDVSLNVSMFTCNGPMSVYRDSNTLVKTNGTGVGATYNLTYTNCEFLGSKEDSNFTIAFSGPAITYYLKPSRTTVLLMCSDGESKLHTYNMNDPEADILAFYSKDSCLKQLEEPGRSFGSTLLIIFFSFVIFYLVLGVATKKFLMGATGVEVIPNLGFWTDLPNLVRDGWAFAIRGCRLPTRGMSPAGPSDPNSYDSI